MEGDEKRTLGQTIDERSQDKDLYKIEVRLIYIKGKSESPKSVKPRK